MRYRAFALLLAAFTATVAQTQLFNGKFLPRQAPPVGPPAPDQLPKTLQQIQSSSADNDTALQYVGNAVNGPYSQSTNVMCNGWVVGTLNIMAGAYLSDFGGAANMNNSGGMLIRGGFSSAAGYQLAPGHSLRYVQVFTETGGNASNTVDSIPGATNPFYPRHTATPGVEPDAMFFDAPADAWTNAKVPTAIDFETALICWDNTTSELDVLGTFDWGYKLDKANKTVTNDYLTGLNAGFSLNFQTVFNKEFGPTGTKGQGWTLDNNCDDCFQAVPEPPTLTVMACGTPCLLLLLIRRRKA